MKIQFNTDKTINGDEKNQEYFSSYITEKLKRFETHITRIEVYLSDENGDKPGVDDVTCLLEARIEHKQPIAVTSKGDSAKLAISSAVEKLKNSLDTVIGKLQNH